MLSLMTGGIIEDFGVFIREETYRRPKLVKSAMLIYPSAGSTDKIGLTM